MVPLSGVKLTKSDALVTVIIPARNSADTLVRCLESICNQTYRNLEIIVWDDCSSDYTYDIAKGFGDNRIVAVRSDRWGAPAYARNRMMDMANGDFVAWQDADDYSHPQRIEHQLIAMVKSGAGLSQCRKQYFSKYEGQTKPDRPEVLVSGVASLGTVCSSVVVSRPKIHLGEYMLTRHEYLWDKMVKSVFSYVVLANRLYYYSSETRPERFTANKDVFSCDTYDRWLTFSAMRRFVAMRSDLRVEASSTSSSALGKLGISGDDPACSIRPIGPITCNKRLFNAPGGLGLHRFQ